MAVSKVILNGQTLIDVTGATASASDIVSPKTAMIANGTLASGSWYTIDDIAQGAYQETNLILPSATYIRPGAFANTSIVSISAPNVQRFGISFNNQVNGSYVFYNCTSLTDVSLPNLTNVSSGGYQFSKCTSLVTVFLPKSNIGQHMFDGCTSLKTIVANVEDVVSDMNGYGFAGCSNLESADLFVKKINGSEFNNCAKLTTIILRYTSIASLSNVNAFNGTPFKSGGTGGTIYIPKTLYDAIGTGTNDYTTATNWVTINGYGTITWAKIEGSYYETHYADGTEISAS